MSLFNLAHSMGNACQDVSGSLGVHMSPEGEPCSLYRGPDPDDTVHVIWRGDVELRATGQCPTLDTHNTPHVSSPEATYP